MRDTTRRGVAGRKKHSVLVNTAAVAEGEGGCVCAFLGCGWDRMGTGAGPRTGVGWVRGQALVTSPWGRWGGQEVHAAPEPPFKEAGERAGHPGGRELESARRFCPTVSLSVSLSVSLYLLWRLVLMQSHTPLSPLPPLPFHC